MGFTAGLLLAFVCFEILPVAFITWGLYYGIVGIIIGVIASVFIESKISTIQMSNTKKYNYNFIKSALLMAFAICIHNIPEGFALGSLLQYNFKSGITMAILICIHCFPESFAICLPLRKSGMSIKSLITYCFILALPMGLGSFVGALLSTFSGLFICLCLSFASGVMLYITCGEMIPESKNIWNGKITSIFSCFGFVLGIVIINVL